MEVYENKAIDLFIQNGRRIIQNLCLKGHRLIIWNTFLWIVGIPSTQRVVSLSIKDHMSKETFPFGRSKSADETLWRSMAKGP